MALSACEKLEITLMQFIRFVRIVSFFLNFSVDYSIKGLAKNVNKS